MLKRTTHYSRKTPDSALMITQGAQDIKSPMGRMLVYLGREQLSALNTIPFTELIWQCGKFQTPLDLRANGLKWLGR